jgi:hypothetical protein
MADHLHHLALRPARIFAERLRVQTKRNARTGMTHEFLYNLDIIAARFQE